MSKIYEVVKLIMYVIMYRFINHNVEIKITNCDINTVNQPQRIYIFQFVNIRLDKVKLKTERFLSLCYHICTPTEKTSCYVYTRTRPLHVIDEFMLKVRKFTRHVVLYPLCIYNIYHTPTQNTYFPCFSLLNLLNPWSLVILKK